MSLGNFVEKLQSIVFAVLHLNMSFQKSVHMEDTKLFINPVCTIKQCDIMIKCKIIEETPFRVSSVLL